MKCCRMRWSALAILYVVFVLDVSVYGQECPNGSTTQLFVGDGSIPLPMTVPACITCNFFSGTGLVNPTDFTWSRNPNSDNIPLTNGSFDGNVSITSDTRTLILVDPAAIVSVNDIIRCDSASNGQHLITIQSFIFTNPIVSPNGTVNVIEGSNLTINCTDPGNTGNTRYQWLNSTGSELTSTVSQNQVPLALSFTDIKRTDSGVYICRSTNPSILPGVIMDSNVTVNVLYVPPVSISSSFDNGTLTINCTFDANPSVNIRWLHNGNMVNSNSNMFTINTNPSYSELIMMRNYSGIYTCIVNNTIDTANATFELPPSVSTEVITSLTVTTITSTVTSSSITKTRSTITYSHMASSTVSTGTIPTIIVHTNTPSGTNGSDNTVAVVFGVFGTIIFILMITISLAISYYCYYRLSKKTNSPFTSTGVTVAFTDEGDNEINNPYSEINIPNQNKELPETESSIDPAMSSEKIVYAKINKPKRRPVPDVPNSEQDLTPPLSASNECLLLNSSSDKILYAELSGLPSARQTKFTKQGNDDKVIYSQVVTANSSPDKVLYADIGTFPVSKQKPTEKIDKVVYSEIGEIKPNPSSPNRTV